MAVLRVKGLRELDRAFRRMDKDLRTDFVWELEEAADPARRLTTQKVLGEIQNMPPTPHYAGMRIGVSAAQTTVYIAPSWRRSSTGRSRPNLSTAIRKRMEAAVREAAPQIEKRVGEMLDRMADEWGSGA